MANSVVYTDGGRVGFVLKGDYDSSATYERLDVVRYSGYSFMCRVDNSTGIAPTPGSTTTNWQPIVDRAGHKLYIESTGNYNEYGPAGGTTEPNVEAMMFARYTTFRADVFDVQEYRTITRQVIIPDVSISASDWAAIQAIFNPTTT